MNPDMNMKITPRLTIEKTEGSRTDPSRPSGRPVSDRNFEKIYDKEKEERPPETPEDVEEPGKKKKPITEPGEEKKPIEEPVGKEKKPVEESAGKEKKELPQKTTSKNENREFLQSQINQPKEAPKESPSDLFRKMEAGRSSKKAESPKKSVSQPTETSSKGEAIAAQSSTPPGIQTAETKSDSQTLTDTSSRIDQVEQLITKMVEEIEIMQSEGRVDTTIRLQHPPLFNGSTVTITSNQAQPGSFQISFHNLDPAAKTLIDMQASQDSLRLALEQKGYTMQITVTSTEPERPIISQESSKSSDQRRGGDQEQQGRGGQEQGRERRQR